MIRDLDTQRDDSRTLIRAVPRDALKNLARSLEQIEMRRRAPCSRTTVALVGFVAGMATAGVIALAVCRYWVSIP